MQWPDVESLIKELQQFKGISSVSKGRYFLSPGLAPTFQVSPYIKHKQCSRKIRKLKKLTSSLAAKQSRTICRHLFSSCGQQFYFRGILILINLTDGHPQSSRCVLHKIASVHLLIMRVKMLQFLSYGGCLLIQ